MPPHYEDGAKLLCLLSHARVYLNRGVNGHTAILIVAAHIHAAYTRPVSHADAAERLLKDLEDGTFVSCEVARRRKALAIIGTFIGNLPRKPALRSQHDAASCTKAPRPRFWPG